MQSPSAVLLLGHGLGYRHRCEAALSGRICRLLYRPKHLVRSGPMRSMTMSPKEWRRLVTEFA
eukprot:scaffold161746_cov32-Tisochrysis_lutea.AAC.1